MSSAWVTEGKPIPEGKTRQKMKRRRKEPSFETARMNFMGISKIIRTKTRTVHVPCHHGNPANGRCSSGLGWGERKGIRLQESGE